MRPFPNLSSALRRRHEAFIGHIRPFGVEDKSADADAVRLVNMVLIGAVSLFSLTAAYGYFGLSRLSVATMLTGLAIISAPWVYKFTGRVSAARESSIFCIFALLWYGATLFQTIASPTGIWFVSLPVVAVMLGGVWSCAFWTTTSSLSCIALYMLYGQNSTDSINEHLHSNFLFTINFFLLIVSIAIFIAMAEMSRNLAYQRLKTTNETLHNLSIRDPLTGAFNRRYICDLLQGNDDRKSSIWLRHWIMLIDIDRFKAINDEYGHGVGDTALKAVSNAISSLVTGNNCFGRYGGEEFIFISTAERSDDVLRLAENIRRGVASVSFDSGHGARSVTVSIGIAEVSRHENFGVAVERADMALYLAKAEGRNCVRQASWVGLGGLPDRHRTGAA